MVLRLILPLLLFSSASLSQVTLTGTQAATGTSDGPDYPTGSSVTYATYESTITRTDSSGVHTDNGSIIVTQSSMAAINSSGTITSSGTTSTPALTILVGGGGTTSTSSLNGTVTGNSTVSRASSSAQPTNTVPCNGYPQFCNRKFSNITHVAAHNSPFVRPDNAASNQQLPVTTQLEDGIRMLQMQTHYKNGTMYLCHTSCEILNVGTLEAYLTTVTQWLQRNPTEVIAILMGNLDFVMPQNYTAPVTNSGLIKYVYTPPKVPMGLEDWPTLGEMILTQQRAIVMLDYQANQTAIPWLLDEFSQMWETPFSPTNRAFPCTAQRPPNSPRSVREDRMYMANHNLNIAVSLAGINLDVPAFNILNETNGVTGYGSVGWAAANCTTDWNRPPNFLLVDYYNVGSFNGSVFQVAADANGVRYNRASCCGTTASSFGFRIKLDDSLLVALTTIATFMVFL